MFIKLYLLVAIVSYVLLWIEYRSANAEVTKDDVPKAFYSIGASLLWPLFAVDMIARWFNRSKRAK